MILPSSLYNNFMPRHMPSISCPSMELSILTLSPEFTFPLYLFSHENAWPNLYTSYIPSHLYYQKNWHTNTWNVILTVVKLYKKKSGILKFLTKKIQCRATSPDKIINLPDIRAGGQSLLPMHQHLSHLILKTIQGQLTCQTPAFFLPYRG